MSETGNFAMEVAEARVEQERDASVARARAGLVGAGAERCTCGAPIPEARRRALPNTRLCIDCAQQREARHAR